MCFVFYFCFSGWHHQVINLVSLLSQQDKIMLWSKFTKTVLVSQMRKFGLWCMMVCKRCDKGRGDRESKSPTSSALHSRLQPLFAWPPTFNLFSLHCKMLTLFHNFPLFSYFPTFYNSQLRPFLFYLLCHSSPLFPQVLNPPALLHVIASVKQLEDDVYKTTVLLYLSAQYFFLLNTSWNNVNVEPI